MGPHKGIYVSENERERERERLRPSVREYSVLLNLRAFSEQVTFDL